MTMPLRPFSELVAAIIAKDMTVGSVHPARAIGVHEKPRAKKFPAILDEMKTAAVAKLGLEIDLASPKFGKAMAEAAAVTKRALQPNTDGETAKSPFDYGPNALSTLRPDQVPRFFDAMTDGTKLPTKQVNLADLHAMQDRVDPAKVAAIANSGTQGKLAIVVSHNGKDYIADGHHRLSADWLSGKDTAEVHHKDLEPVDNAVKREAPPTWSLPFTVTKADPDQRLIFGWASVVEKNGKMVFDHQDDGIPVDELEKAAYDFVLYSRENDDLHVGGPTGRCIESMVFTKEKQDALGIILKDKDGDPFIGWWTGFKVDDPNLWAAHKRGERPEFSIGGQGVRERIDQ